MNAASPAYVRRLSVYEGAAFSWLEVMMMERGKDMFEDAIAQHPAATIRERNHRVIGSAKRTAWDKWFRGESYRGTTRIGGRYRKEGSWRRQRPWNPVVAKVRG